MATRRTQGSTASCCIVVSKGQRFALHTIVIYVYMCVHIYLYICIYLYLYTDLILNLQLEISQSKEK